jgi:hypothetical protein
MPLTTKDYNIPTLSTTNHASPRATASSKTAHKRTASFTRDGDENVPLFLDFPTTEHKPTGAKDVDGPSEGTSGLLTPPASQRSPMLSPPPEIQLEEERRIKQLVRLENVFLFYLILTERLVAT